MTETCLLCEKYPVEIEFNCVFPSEEGTFLVQAGICFTCFGSHIDDMSIARALLKKRSNNERKKNDCN